MVTAIVARREALTGPQKTGAQRNVRVREAIAPQLAPDPERQGSIPCRPSRIPVWTSLFRVPWEEGDFGPNLWAPQHFAGQPSGRQLNFGQRANIAVPSAVAYGSLFQFDSQPYVIGG